MRNAAEHDDWLARHSEAILEPGREITDPHHHLWEDRLGRRYALPEFHADTGSGHRVTQTVFIECGAGYDRGDPDPFAPVAETRYVAAIAAEAARKPDRAQIAAIVAHADLRQPPDVLDAVLDAHLRAAPNLFRGIRHAGAWDEERAHFIFRGQSVPHLYADPDFRRGLRHLGRRGLSFDTWHFHPQNPEFRALARACPETTIVLDHIGLPLGVGRFAGRRADVFARWQDDIAAIAALPNVVVKLGGLGMPEAGFGWDVRPAPPTSDEIAEAHGPWYRHAIEMFGPGRAMFESNFPVDRLSLSYPVYWNAMKKIAAPFDAPAQDQLFAGTADRVYRL